MTAKANYLRVLRHLMNMKQRVEGLVQHRRFWEKSFLYLTDRISMLMT